MKCECGGRLLATHTFVEGQAVTRERKCDKCGQRRTSVELLVEDREKEGGARVQLRKIKEIKQ